MDFKSGRDSLWRHLIDSEKKQGYPDSSGNAKITKNVNFVYCLFLISNIKNLFVYVSLSCS